ncbi:hypothetical protein K432DRAFT_341908 [Lepidopterella palustris CBS 459.81]|uniref:Uncharacterized protein n=1 Tax=Lepidopterella palustris CBS 459.81 TaxID=1314670 RepID=A0A8E2ELB1_9PEZI|nr:hypothetical protein K432DRAFT_341908 [Lepidopterella palustris CBS 459.81]
MLQAVECKTNNDIALRFKDNAAFSYAVQTWDWVNRNDNYTFVLITNNDGCVTSGDRKPFVVSHLTYDASDYTINMDAQARNWTDIAHTYSLSIRHGPPIPSFRLVRRADVSLNLASDFSGNLLQESVYGVDMSVDCTNCGTSGSLRVDFDISVSWFSLDSASITIQPRSVEAFLEIQLSASGAQSTPYGWEKTLISIPIEGFDIPDIITLGGFLDVAAGYSLSKWSGNAVATMGATMKLSDSAIVEVDLVNSGNNRFSGWSPVFNVIPIEVNAKVGGNAEVFVQPAVMLAAEALGK